MASGDESSLHAEQLVQTPLGGGALVVELTLHATEEGERSGSSGAEIPGVDARGHSSEKRLVEFFMACKFLQPI